MPPGRDQVKAMERLARILAVLDDAGDAGVSARRLIEIAEYGGDNEADLLGKDLKHLGSQGWDIKRISPVGVEGRYRMTSGDNRLKVKLTDAQRAALQRAVILANRADLAKRLGVEAGSLPAGIGVDVVPQAESAELSLSHSAVRLRSRIRFSYKGIARVVHPGAVRFQNYKWYLSGAEDGSGQVKNFVVAGMSEVSLDKPGTAQPVAVAERLRLHPLLWNVDEPTPATVRTTPEFVPDVVRWLNEPDSQNAHDGVVDLHYTVTHRAAFRSRIYVLGGRVGIVDGGAVAEDVVGELRRMVGE
ncbi:MAG: helix-turn-helix transcriptional regulator [Sporichthyaceae bacterium]